MQYCYIYIGTAANWLPKPEFFLAPKSRIAPGLCLLFHPLGLDVYHSVRLPKWARRLGCYRLLKRA